MRTRTALAALAVALLGTTGWSLSQDNQQAISATDYTEIQQLYARYNWAIDVGDAAGYAATFTADGVFNANVGHDAIVKFAESFHAGIGSHVRHWNTNLLITPTPTGANGQVYLVLVDFATKPATIMASASYSDELVRTPQGWRFSKRMTKGDVAPPRP